MLLNHGAAVNIQCCQGWTALQEAVCRNHVEICEMLLKAGAKLNLGNIYGIKPLFTAAQSGQLATLRLLLKHGTRRGSFDYFLTAPTANCWIYPVLLNTNSN